MTPHSPVTDTGKAFTEPPYARSLLVAIPMTNNRIHRGYVECMRLEDQPGSIILPDVKGGTMDRTLSGMTIGRGIFKKLFYPTYGRDWSHGVSVS